MDHLPTVNELLKALWWLIPLVLAIHILFRVLKKLPWFKGMRGETFVMAAAKLRLPSETYRPIHNITLPTPDGTTQIDHIIVSRFGIFVVETKNMKGWIFGRENQAQWTQKIFRESFTFQNPLRQNYKHAKALEAALDVPASAIRSVVVFTGKSSFKTPMPPNVTHGWDCIRYIKSFREPVLSDSEVQSVVAQIQSGRLTPSNETSNQHIRQLRSRSNPGAERLCPKCGSNMVLRTAKRGKNAGSQFWGCSAYPKCRVVQNVT